MNLLELLPHFLLWHFPGTEEAVCSRVVPRELAEGPQEDAEVPPNLLHRRLAAADGDGLVDNRAGALLEHEVADYDCDVGRRDGADVALCPLGDGVASGGDVFVTLQAEGLESLFEAGWFKVVEELREIV